MILDISFKYRFCNRQPNLIPVAYRDQLIAAILL